MTVSPGALTLRWAVSQSSYLEWVTDGMKTEAEEDDCCSPAITLTDMVTAVHDVMETVSAALGDQRLAILQGACDHQVNSWCVCVYQSDRDHPGTLMAPNGNQGVQCFLHLCTTMTHQLQ